MSSKSFLAKLLLYQWFNGIKKALSDIQEYTLATFMLVYILVCKS